MLNGRPFEYINLPIFLHTSFLSSCFHFEFKVLCLGCEVVNLSMGPLGIGSPLPLPNVPIILDKALSCIDVGPIPISWSNSFLFVFLSLKLANVSLRSNLASSLILLHHNEFWLSDAWVYSPLPRIFDYKIYILNIAPQKLQ